MSKQSGYKKQQNLTSVQLLAEVPTFVETLLSAFVSGALLLYVDLLDSLGYMIRYAIIIVLSKKLTHDLRYEYNYGIGKIEAVSSLLCDSIVLFGMFLTLCFSIYSFFYPSKPSDYLIAVVGFKLYDIMWDLAFFIKQRKIYKANRSAICESNYAAALGALLFDCVTFFSLLFMWVLRNNPIGGYISPVVSIVVAVYLTVGCVRRIKAALNEITDKTLPEEQQLKILSVLNRHFDSYGQFHFINSHKNGDNVRVDLHLSFENSTTPEDIVTLKEQLKNDYDEVFGNCVVNVIPERNEQHEARGEETAFAGK